MTIGVGGRSGLCLGYSSGAIKACIHPGTTVLEGSMSSGQTLKKEKDEMLKYLRMKTCLALAVSCLAFAPGLASAMPITKTVDVSVYQLCNSTGDCASKGPAGND